MDTIFGRSTAPGRAGLAVIRLSGPAAWDIVEDLTGRPPPPPRYLTRRDILWSGETIDQAMVVCFEEGRSFTGERSAELHLHGSEAVLRAVLERLADFPQARLARPGEFTHRALLNDKMDLSEVEGLNALLLAETEAQRRQAVRVLDGVVREKADGWRGRLIQLLAVLEVSVDFADEDVPSTVSQSVVSALRDLAEELKRDGEGALRAQKISRGFEVALVGAPNTGKSTLLNRLAGREAALTSEVAGTTRDIIEVRIEVAGHLVALLDTAGIRQADDEIEQAGVARARMRAEGADLRVFLDAVPREVVFQANDIRAAGKADLGVSGKDGLPVSGVTGEGIDALLDLIGERLSEQVSGVGAAITERQASALLKGAEALAESASVLEASQDQVEIVSHLVREGIWALDEVVGRVGVEDILGEIFSQFCIGK